MERDLKYTEQITGLNISVLNWIKEHIDKNPLIDLTPVFRDYEKYMHEIEEKYGQGTTGNLTKNNETPTSSKQNPDQQKTPGNNVAEVSPLTSKEISKPSFMSSTPLLQNQLQSTNGQKGRFLLLLFIVF